MQVKTRVIVNTLILYLKVILSLLISLISVPLVFKALGASDYGLYNLVAGVVAMLAFLNNSMTVSTQRFMSVAMGEKKGDKINVIYNTSFFLHLILGICVVAIFEIAGFWAIDGLNIPSDRINCAKIIFHFLIVNTFIKIISVPFDALINAKEDMLPFSIIELVDSFLMLLAAFIISYISGDRLIFYGLFVALISLISFIMKYLWCKFAYRESIIDLRKYKEKLRVKEMLGFTGWNLFGGMAMVGRNQGISIIINIFLGTIANAAYGVANQINGALCHFSTTFQKAINPQLMKSEGMKDRNRMLRISFISSKFSVLAIALFAVPIVIEMEEILSIWLKGNIPPYTLQLSQLILILSIVYQYSAGIMSAIQATGKIKNYQLIMGTILLLNIPIAYLLLKLCYPIYYITAAFIVLEVVSLVVRLLIAQKQTDMQIIDYIKLVIFPTLQVILMPTIVALLIHLYMPQNFFRLLIVSVVYCVLFLSLMWKYALDYNQRLTFIIKFKHVLNKS